MKSLVTITALAVAATMVLPLGVQAWGSYGGSEPDTSYDHNGGYMFPDGPGVAKDRIYFNVFNGITATGAGGGLGSPGLSPNEGTLGDRLESPGGEAFVGLFGQWTDCNHDGYIGLADGALREYQKQVSDAAGHPVDLTICPDLNDAPANVGKIHYDSASGWVTELIPIGYQVPNAQNKPPTAITTDYRTISDVQAKVWGDNVAPGASIATAAVCTTLFGSDAEGGQLHHTGGVAQHLDCLDGSAADLAHDALAGSDPTGTVAGTPEPSSLYAQGGQADQKTPALVGGPDGSGSSFVSGEQDCNAAPLTGSALDPVFNNAGNGNNGHRGPRAPGSPAVNPNGNVPGTVNETHEEVFATDDCSTGDDYGHDAYQPGGVGVEGSGPDTSSTTSKIAAEYNFVFRPWNNRQGAAINGCGAGATGKVCGTPADAGLPEAYSYDGSGQNQWTSVGTVGTAPAVGGASSDRSTTPPTVTPNAFPANWYTFYAFTSESGFSLPTNTGTYGTEWCADGVGSGASSENGWDCDGADWNLDPSTGQKLPNDYLLGTVGDSYQFRDVDCYDTTLATAAGTAVGPHALDAVTPLGPACT
ncbi:MAG: hypothetical protein QOE90_1125 [Thermoplasmata archaeon]|jgi:hypothetical protein|nr:hypothetical protein [Thermoplasmata archaeon]